MTVRSEASVEARESIGWDRARIGRVAAPGEAAEILRSCREGLCARLHKPPLRQPRPAS